jgi:hypothetical protein
MDIIISNDAGGREWLLARIQTDRWLTMEEADATIAHLARTFGADGWQFAGSSNGWSNTQGHYQIEIDGVRGNGPRTAAELEAQRTFSGRD